ncbi:MAG TPA: ABC transporter ATP-binding protein [Gemmatimonadales bacterium]|jgi:ATP-binding cassette subfamily B protein|nr:ABC transporter ATP-binding protein [Gemmatimonadales bacterium]
MPETPSSPPAESAGSRLGWRDRLQAFHHLPWFLGQVWRVRRSYAALVLGLRIARAVAPLGILWVGKLIVDAVVAAIADHTGHRAVPWHYLGTLVVLELAIVFVGEIIARAALLFESLLNDLYNNRLSEALLEHAATLDLRQFEDPGFYDHLERARQQTAGRTNLITMMLDLLQNAVTLVTFAITLLAYVPWLLGLLFVAVIPSFLGETHYAGLNYLLRRRWTAETRQIDYLRYTGASDRTAKEVKLFGLSHWLLERYRGLADGFYRESSALSKRRTAVILVLTLVSSLGYYFAYAWIIYLTVIGHRSPAGAFTLGVLTLLSASFRQSRDLIQAMLLGTAQLAEQALYLNDLATFLEMKPAIVSEPGAPQVPEQLTEGFELRDVGFKYPGSERWAVRHVSFTLKPGERLSLVGENGVGKTTIVKLLTRLYDPDEGTVLLDGKDLKSYDIESVRRAFGVIFQDFVRYNFLFRENIAVGEITALDDAPRIGAAAQQSLAAEVVARLPQGYDQMLGRHVDGGVELSGGEWQKVALARAYFRDAQLLILDEPSSALDARAECEVFERFDDLADGKMAVLISHRFSTVRMADRVLVLANGEIVERGTHDELVRAGGTYAELFELQAAAYR